VDPARIAYFQDTPLVVNMLTAAARERLAERRVAVAPKMPDGPGRDADAVEFFARLLERTGGSAPKVVPISVRPAAPTSAQRHLAAATRIPIEEVVYFNPRGRDRHYIIDAHV